MNGSDLIALVPGVLQLAVACCALRLIRLVNARRSAWLLFSAFGLLALVHLLLSFNLLPVSSALAIGVNFTYAVISVLLFAGLVCLKAPLKARLLAERSSARQEAQAEFAVQFTEQTAQLTEQIAQLTKAKHELTGTNKDLQAKIAERIAAQEQLEKTHRDMMTVSRQAGMSEVATAVLHNVGNVLNSVNISTTLVADRLAEYNIHGLGLAAKMMRDHAKDLGEFIVNDLKGKQLPVYLSQLASHLSSEQASILKEIGFVKTKIGHIKEIVATQQRYGRVIGLVEKVKVSDLVEDVIRIHASELAQNEVQIQREYEAAVPEVLLDKHKVLQILVNLLSNANLACIESSHKERQVTISVTNGDDRLRVAMRDNGVGIPAANLTQIFNHGFTTRKKGGHGFGLHSGALAAKEMGGSLSAISDGLGKGATFTLEIPVKHTRNSQQGGSINPQKANNKPTVGQ